MMSNSSPVCSLSIEPAVTCFVSPLLEANSYVILHSDEALVIDPNTNPQLVEYLKDHAVSKIIILLTHEHLDHTCGVPLLAKHFQPHLICQQNCAVCLQEGCQNSRMIISLMLRVLNEKQEQDFLNSIYDWSYTADTCFDDKYSFNWFGHTVALTHTPGHSAGSCCILINNQILFCGDSLLRNFPAITRLPGGNTQDYRNITIPFLQNLPPQTTVFSGHYQSFRLEEILKESANVELAPTR